MYIKSYVNRGGSSEDFVIKDIGINFSDNFNCLFTDNESLIIKEIETPNSSFYSKNIKSLNLIVGENGCGKTTILDLIGMSFVNRRRDHYESRLVGRNTESMYYSDQLEHYTSEYFLIYSIEGNSFLIEPCINYNDDQKIGLRIKNLDVHEKLVLSESNSVIDIDERVALFVNYDYRANKLTYDRTKHLKINHPIKQSSSVHYFTNQLSKRHGEESSVATDDSGYFISRHYYEINEDSPSRYFSIIKLLNNKKYTNFREEMIKCNPKVYFYIDVETNYQLLFEDEFFDTINRKKIKVIFENINKKIKIENQSNKNTYMSTLLKNHYIQFIYNFCSCMQRPSIKKDEFGQDEIVKKLKKVMLNIKEQSKIDISSILGDPISDDERKKILSSYFHLSQKIVDIASEFHDHNTWQQYHDSFMELYLLLLDVDDKFFEDSRLVFGSKIDVDDSTEKLFELLEAQYKKMIRKDNSEHNVSKDFAFKISDLSSGEIVMIKQFALLLDAVKNENESFHLMLLDEPDNHLHPEWCRRMISNLVNIVDAINTEEREVNIQFIISTHSPIMLSDIRDVDYLLLKKNRNEFSIVPKDENMNVFGAHIYDIMKKNFFLENNAIGEFALNKMSNKLELLKLKEKEFVDIDNIDSKLNEMQNFIDSLGEPILKNHLMSQIKTRKKWLEMKRNTGGDDIITKNNLDKMMTNMDKDKIDTILNALNSYVNGMNSDKERDEVKDTIKNHNIFKVMGK